MPSIFHDKHGAIAQFRALHAPGRLKRRVRVPVDRQADAQMFANECDAICRLLERTATPDQMLIGKALELGAIKRDQADALLTGNRAGASTSISRGPLTIVAAARSHPASQREARESPRSAYAHEAWLQGFLDFAQIKAVDQLTLDKAQAWIAEMVRRGWAWDTRRHALAWLRRAARMGALAGIPDQLQGLLRDERDDHQRVEEVWSLAELGRAYKALAADPRARSALVLGGFLGLRPSETSRLTVGDIDLDGNRLSIGSQGAKNSSSRRKLPMPSIVAQTLREAASGRQAAEYLIAIPKGRMNAGQPYGEGAWVHWLKPILTKATGRAMAPKYLRKSFSSWAFRAGLPPAHVEAFMGHQTALVSRVMGRHYLPEMLAAEIAPTAKRIDAIVRKALGPAGKPAKARKGAQRPRRTTNARKGLQAGATST